jgi:hypothetical protein
VPSNTAPYTSPILVFLRNLVKSISKETQNRKKDYKDSTRPLIGGIGSTSLKGWWDYD